MTTEILCCKTCTKSRLHRGEILMCHQRGDFRAVVCRDVCEDYELDRAVLDVGKLDSAEGLE